MSEMAKGSPLVSYPPMPPEPSQGLPTGTAAPPPVLNAVRLMLARAAIGVVSLIVLLATKSTLKSEILKNNHSADPARLNSLLNGAIAVGVVIGLVFLVLYVLLAFQVRKGKNWARIVTFVLAALGVLSVLGSIAQPAPTPSRVISVIAGIIDLVIIVFLAQRPSREFFRPRA